MGFNVNDIRDKGFGTRNPLRMNLFNVRIDRPGAEPLEFLINKVDPGPVDAHHFALWAYETDDDYARKFFNTWRDSRQACDVTLSVYGSDGTVVQSYVFKGSVVMYVNGPVFDWGAVTEISNLRVMLSCHTKVFP